MDILSSCIDFKINYAPLEDNILLKIKDYTYININTEKLCSLIFSVIKIIIILYLYLFKK